VKENALATLSSLAANETCSAKVASTIEISALWSTCEPLLAADEANLLTLGLLFVNLLGLSDAQGISFQSAVQTLYREHSFARHIAAAFEAACNGLEWPAGSNRFPPLARMVKCCVRLAHHDFHAELMPVIPLLMDSIDLADLESETLVSLRMLAEYPAAFALIDGQTNFFRDLSESEEASALKDYMHRMRKTAVIWTSPASDISFALQLLSAQCNPRHVEWREGVANKDSRLGFQSLVEVEGHDPRLEYTPTQLAGAAWLWSENVPLARLGLCFAAFRTAGAERARRRQALSNDLCAFACELPVLRRGSEVVSGVDVLWRLAEIWGQPELHGGEQMPKVASTVDLLLKLRQKMLHGMVLPQAKLNSMVAEQKLGESNESSTDEAIVFQAVQHSRVEARALLQELDAQLGTAKRGYLHAGRLTIADLVAAAVLHGAAGLAAQGWSEYPILRKYLQRMQMLTGFADASTWRADLVADLKKALRSSGSPLTI
jgi:hypothetical protein